MNRKRFFVILILAVLMVFQCSCGKKEPTAGAADATPKTEKLVGAKELTDFSVKLQEGRHNRDEILPRVFNVWTAETEAAQYQVESTTLTYMDAVELIALVENDVRQILDYSGFSPDPKPIVIIVDSDTFGKPLGASYMSGNTAVMSSPLILQNEHFAALASAVLCTADQWVGQGVCELLINGVPDSKYLADYYNGGGDMDILGLFCARFDDRLCGAKEASVARASAASLVNYIVNKGMNLSEHNFVATLKQEWLKSIGVTKTYKYPYEGELAGFWINASSNEAYDFVLNSDLAVYHIAWQKDESCLMSSVHNLEYFLHRNYSGLLLLKDSIAANGTQRMLEGTAKKLMYNIDETGYQSAITMEGAMPSGEIFLPDTYSASHRSLREAVRSYAGAGTKKWLEIGLAEYYSAIFLKDYEFLVEERDGFRNCDYRYLLMRDLVFNKDAFDFEDSEWGKSYYTDILEYYMGHGGSMTTQSDFDPELFYNAAAFTSLNSNKTKSYDAWLDTRPISVKYNISEEGSEMDNYQAGSFVNYLVKTYSLKNVMTVYSDYSKLVTVFGKGYEELKADWVNSVKNF
jgi:hypothetical protein